MLLLIISKKEMCFNVEIIIWTNLTFFKFTCPPDWIKEDSDWLWFKLNILGEGIVSYLFWGWKMYQCVHVSRVYVWCLYLQQCHNSAYGNTLSTKIMSLIFILINNVLSLVICRCYLEDGASKGAWLNRSSIIFAGGDKWSVDPRVSISTLNKRDYSLQIQNVDVTDDGPYTCSVQTQHTPRTMQVHLTVQGTHFHICYIVKVYA